MNEKENPEKKAKCRPKPYSSDSILAPLESFAIGFMQQYGKRFYTCGQCKARIDTTEGQQLPKFCWKCQCEIDWSQKDVSGKVLICPSCKAEYPLERMGGYCERDLTKLVPKGA